MTATQALINAATTKITAATGIRCVTDAIAEANIRSENVKYRTAANIPNIFFAAIIYSRFF